ncbi:MAG: bifunctional adenosylcobinamide kinase/adenosylcobinamide-phosphate guanylyltransferase [Candidatus Omnitrophota bacterium]
MKRIIFIIGGVRSGKSAFAIKLAKDFRGPVAFVATCMPKDKEMHQRIKAHKNSRPAAWKTIVEEKDIFSALKETSKYPVVIIDCLTLLVSNLLLSSKGEKTILADIKKFLYAACNMKKTFIIVSNEVGCGIVPENALARRFRDIHGQVNKIVAEYSDDVYLMIAGIPANIKKVKR